MAAAGPAQDSGLSVSLVAFLLAAVVVVGQSTLDGSLFLGPTGWRVSSVARPEAKTGPMGGDEQGEKGERDVYRETQREKRCSRRWIQDKVGRRLS
jgi:hypothetical protein